MKNKVDYKLKFYAGYMTNENDETYNFYLAARTVKEGIKYIEQYVRSHPDRYHLIPYENDIANINLVEVGIENYGNNSRYEVIN